MYLLSSSLGDQCCLMNQFDMLNWVWVKNKNKFVPIPWDDYQAKITLRPGDVYFFPRGCRIPPRKTLFSGRKRNVLTLYVDKSILKWMEDDPLISTPKKRKKKRGQDKK